MATDRLRFFGARRSNHLALFLFRIYRDQKSDISRCSCRENSSCPLRKLPRSKEPFGMPRAPLMTASPLTIHPRPLEVIISISRRVNRHGYHHAPVFFLLLTGAVGVQGSITSRRNAPANHEPSRRPCVHSSPSGRPSGMNLRPAHRLASRSRARLLQMVEQRDDAAGRRFGNRVGDVAPGPVQAAGGDRILLIDLADLPAIGVEEDPADRHLLLA